MSLELTDDQFFAKGGNRLCFVHPKQSDHCIKVRRPDYTLEDMRRKKGFPKTLLPLSHFDDNREEHDVIEAIARHCGDEAFQHVSRCYGYVDTNYGKGLELELVRDADGRISQTLKAEIWHNDISASCQRAIEQFIDHWQALTIPSRDLLLHNILVQKDQAGEITRLVVVDGLGSPNIIPFWWLSKNARASKVARKLTNFRDRIQQLLDKKAQGVHPGNHGFATAHFEFRRNDV